MSLGFLLNTKRTARIYEDEAKSAYAFYMNSLFTLIFGVFIIAVMSQLTGKLGLFRFMVGLQY